MLGSPLSVSLGLAQGQGTPARVPSHRCSRRLGLAGLSHPWPGSSAPVPACPAGGAGRGRLCRGRGCRDGVGEASPDLSVLPGPAHAPLGMGAAPPAPQNHPAWRWWATARQFGDISCFKQPSGTAGLAGGPRGPGSVAVTGDPRTGLPVLTGTVHNGIRWALVPAWLLLLSPH